MVSERVNGKIGSRVLFVSFAFRLERSKWNNFQVSRVSFIYPPSTIRFTAVQFNIKLSEELIKHLKHRWKIVVSLIGKFDLQFDRLRRNVFRGTNKCEKEEMQRRKKKRKP